MYKPSLLRHPKEFQNPFFEGFTDYYKTRFVIYPLAKQKKYTKNSERLENYLKSQNYNQIQTQQILVKDYYKQVKEEVSDWKVFILGERVKG